MKTLHILKALKVLAYIAFIGYAIEAGAIIVNYILGFRNPTVARHFYGGMDLYELRELSLWYYTQYIAFFLAIAMLKSYVWEQAIKALSQINLSDPFTVEVSSRLEKIAYVLFGIWIVEIAANGYVDWLHKSTAIALENPAHAGEYLLVAGLLYLFSQIFRRGIELQSDNDLTI